ncbi:hypothetical protein NO932_18435 [Pelagibacterium sp. 26DY04]|nr:hypothetical protein [Pelagibacterium sp. 26DY04]WMT88959.1 hypothetical protein NO932_18435 [Pelagibacterium sp. 26DY04]
MKRTGLMMGGAVLALGLALGGPAFSQDIDFGDDSSTFANDQQCDDPRFEGPGAAMVLSPVDEMRDATDCQAAFEAGEVTLAAEGETGEPAPAPDAPATAAAPAEGEIDFGDDSGNWANDGECDDPRFGGGLESHLLADATDCRTAYEAGEVTFAPQESADAGVTDGEIDFGDDSGNWANDGECDDPRFGGALTSHELADATDCRNAYEAGEVTYTPAGEADTQTGATDGEIDFGDDSGSFANDGECDDPRFGGALTSHELADATDCQAAYEAGDVTYSGETGTDAGGEISIDDIDFGDDSGTWANDGECDDPRFGGSLTSHELADATDCRNAYEAGEVTFNGETGAAGGDPIVIDGIDFGDDSGTYSLDDECDDPRFTGSGVGVALDDHLMADATDCSTAYEDGTVTLDENQGSGESIVVDDIDFGDDSGNWANDGECDDPRFTGSGVGVALDDHLMADATDCSTAYEDGTVTLEGDAGSDEDFRINFGDDSSASANDGVCDDPRFQGRGGASELQNANRMADATDCRAAYDAGTVTYNP